MFYTYIAGVSLKAVKVAYDNFNNKRRYDDDDDDNDDDDDEQPIGILLHYTTPVC